MRRRLVLAAVLLAACRFNTSGSGTPVDAAQVTDAPADGASEGAAADGPLLAELRLDRPADQRRSEQRLFDGARDQRPPDNRPLDQRPPDLRPSLDLRPPDKGCASSDCPLGCHATENRCKEILPSNVPAADAKAAAAAATADVTPGASSRIDFNGETGEVKTPAAVLRAAGSAGTAQNGIYWDTVTQSGAPTLGLFAMKSLSIPATTRLELAGKLPVAIYVKTTVQIAGLLSANAALGTARAGGYLGGLNNGANGAACSTGEGKGGAQAGSGSNQTEAGGGGGGFGQAGAQGGSPGSPYAPCAGGAGGNAGGNASLVPLRGGCGAGAGGGPDTGGGAAANGGHGGAGGGAVQLSAGVSIVVSGAINAGGGGGGGGHYGAGGGGGGAGGAILLEAPTVTVSGVLAAKGGGGGAGGYDILTANMPDGGDGDATVGGGGLGGAGSGYGGSGGNGGATAAPTAGGSDANGGGGGGGAGRIRINGLVVSASSTFPQANITGTVGTR